MQTGCSVAAEVVVPLYQERAMVHRVHAAMAEFVHRNPSWRVRFVDDGSSDGTPVVLRTMLAVNDEGGRLTLDELSRNVGKASAVAHGIAQSHAERVYYMDGDLAYDPAMLLQLDRALDDADVAIGSRAIDPDSRRLGFLRRFMGQSYNLLVRAILALPHRDTQAGIKGFRKAAARTLFQARRANDFGFDAELLFIARSRGLRVAEVPVAVSDEHASIGSNVRLLRDPIAMLAGMVRIRANSIMGRYRA